MNYTHKGKPVKDTTTYVDMITGFDMDGNTRYTKERIGYPTFETEEGETVYWTDPPTSIQGESCSPWYGVFAGVVIVIASIACILTV